MLEASCQSPVATFATVSGDAMSVTALVAMPDGSRSIRDQVNGPADEAEQLGEQLAARLLAQGAAELLAAAGASHA